MALTIENAQNYDKKKEIVKVQYEIEQKNRKISVTDSKFKVINKIKEDQQMVNDALKSDIAHV